ncbi:MAG: BrnT family toxin [Haliscomenobacter sp.]|nr:BrnT family toxin [Haliscomenobacter sp.]
MKFTWDENKNQANKEKHKINFEEAKCVFDDPDAIELEAHRNGEYRIIRIGKTATKIILLIVYTMRDLVVRLISARQANRDERNLYLEHKLKNQNDERTDR